MTIIQRAGHDAITVVNILAVVPQSWHKIESDTVPVVVIS